jgi:hypothetical protein
MDYEYNKNFGAFVRNRYNYPIEDYLLNPDALDFGIEYDINVAAVWIGNNPLSYAFCDLTTDTTVRLSHSSGTLSSFTIDSTNIIANSSSKIMFNSPLVECLAEIKAPLGTFASLSAPYKMFDIKHPSKENMRLRHACLEGPEISVFIKGRLHQTKTIKLPNFWKDLIHFDSINVSLTSIGEYQELSVISIDENKYELKIKENTNKQIDCFYTVIATRKDVEPLQVEVKDL